MKFYEELEKLREVKRECLLEMQGFEEKKQNEIAAAIAQINQKYSELSRDKYLELSNCNDRIDAFCKTIASHSSFDAKEIGEIIASLIRIFEGINYIYQDTYYYRKEVEILAFDKIETVTKTRLRIIVAEEDKSKTYTEDDLFSLIKKGKVIILSNRETLDKEITFYVANTNNHTLEQCIKLGRFSYIKDFIDKLISYKIDQISKQLTNEELMRLRTDFIRLQVEQIKENYRAIEKQQEEQIREKLDTERENREARLRRVLDEN